MIEIWLPVPIKEYSKDYEVSNFGNVRSLNYRGNGQTKILKPGKHTRGYLCVVFYKNGKKRIFYIHRLVAEAFIPNLLELPQVNHIDENKTNNRVENLEWCDSKFNCNHGTRNERSAKSRSKPVLQLTKTGELVREWPSTKEAGRNGYSQWNICSCCSGKLKSYKGFIWKYK